ncbi:MAG TPA: hypothetical protein VEC99_01590, partial [Clostridia bacterium]|nr:hypothetical protein [Clostridia bacterium]
SDGIRQAMKKLLAECFLLECAIADRLLVASQDVMAEAQKEARELGKKWGIPFENHPAITALADLPHFLIMHLSSDQLPPAQALPFLEDRIK